MATMLNHFSFEITMTSEARGRFVATMRSVTATSLKWRGDHNHREISTHAEVCDRTNHKHYKTLFLGSIWCHDVI